MGAGGASVLIVSYKRKNVKQMCTYVCETMTRHLELVMGVGGFEFDAAAIFFRLRRLMC